MRSAEKYSSLLMRSTKEHSSLKLLIVMNDYDSKTNGMAISTQRFVHELRSAGVTVRIMAAGTDAANQSDVDYPLPVWKIPVLDGIIRREGFTFAKTDRKRIKAAVEWADIVHVEDPFPLCSAAVQIAHERKKPVVGTWHLYPENMTMSAHLDRIKPLNTFFFYQFRSMVYDRCDRIVCPSGKVKSRLKKSGCTVPMSVISNGIDASFIGRPDSSDPHPFTVVTIGRLSPEKDQITLIRALGKSGHQKDMRLIIAGKGPLEKKLKKEASALSMIQKPLIRYFPQKQLRALLKQADLYVHCAVVEVEGMSAMEAFASGAVPVIARAPLSATDEYAIQKEMIFPCGNSDVLAARIDYWFEHPQERISASKKMQKKAEALTVKKSAEKLLELYNEVLNNKKIK